MNTLLTFKEWISTNWIILVLIVLAIAMLVPTYIRQKKETTARNELNNTIKKGTRIITTAGVYGVVEKVRETSDGKVVTIVTGNSKNPTTMDIHINAIGGIDNKSDFKDSALPKVEDATKATEEGVEEVDEKSVKAEEDENKTEKKPSKATSAKKSTTKKSK